MRRSGYDEMRTAMLTRWAETGETPQSHAPVGKLNGVEIKKSVREVSRDVLQLGRVDSNYQYLAVQIELARRGPPSGFDDWGYSVGAVGWVCYDAKEGWRPLLSGRKDEDEL